jgi:hypothetical protein
VSTVETVEVIEPWLFSLLSLDATLEGMVGDRIVGTVADDELNDPYVVFSLNSTRDVNGIGSLRVMTDNLYVAKVVGRVQAWEPLLPIARRVTTLLEGATGSTVAGHVLGVRREQVVQYVEVDAGQQWRHVGGLFRVWASA